VGKPGWNLKYKKSRKAICTIYPEKSCFVVLVVVPVATGALLLPQKNDFHPWVSDLIEGAKPYIGTYWLMIPVVEKAILENVKKLLVMKSDFR
jgi:hypothetical protein